MQHKQELLESVRWGNLPRLKGLLREGGDVNALYPNGKTLLITAVEAGEQAVVEYLIGVGANLNQRDFSDRTPLMYAADRSDISITRLLLDAGADVNAQNKQGLTALMYAAYRDALDVVEALMNAGADVNLKDHGNRTALNYTDFKRANKSQKVLKAHGAAYAPVQTQTVLSSFREALQNARSMDEFTELKRSPGWGCTLLIASYLFMFLMFGLQFVCGPFILLLLLGVTWSLSLTFPSTWKIVPLWSEIRSHRTESPSTAQAAETIRMREPKTSDIEFVSQLMDLGSRELSSIHRIYVDGRSQPVLISLFNSRLRSVLLAVSIFLPVLIMFLPGISRTGVDAFLNASAPIGILYIALFVLLPLWIPISFKLERRLRLERLRLIQQDRDRIAGDISTMLNAEDFADKELPADFGLYLRAFMTTDKLHLRGFDLETMIAYSIAPTLPLLALGKPGEHLGAGRIQTTDEHWQEEILHLMQTARLILIIPSHRAGTLWEIATLRNGGFLDKTIFIMPPEMEFHGGKFSDDWQKTVLAAGEAGVEFPEHISTGAFFRLNADGGFADYSPFVPEEFLMEFDPTVGGADFSSFTNAYAGFDTGGADGMGGGDAGGAHGGHGGGHHGAGGGDSGGASGAGS